MHHQNRGKGSKFKLYQWTGNPEEAPAFVKSLSEPGKSNPEGLIVYPDEKRVLIVNDQGKREIDGVKCQDIDDENIRHFIGRWHEV